MSTYGMWLSTTGMKVSEHRQTLMANNMANVSTTGFKHDLAVMQRRPVESREDAGGMRFQDAVLDRMSGGIEVLQPRFTTEQGHIDVTGRPLDLAIQGDGYFQVKNGDETRYTRNGTFTMNATGEVVLATGSGVWNVVDTGGAPILLDPAGPAPLISKDGTVMQGTDKVGRVALVAQDDPTKLRKTGETLFELRDGEMRPSTAMIVPSALERSTFDPMAGIAAMIEASRAYQLNATMIQLQDQLTGQAVSTIGRMA